jgi:hypothetical protein
LFKEKIPDASTILKLENFEFDAINSHLNHCFFANRAKLSKEPSYLTLSNLLIFKYQHDRLLDSMRAIAASSDSLYVPTLEKALTLKASSLTELISS